VVIRPGTPGDLPFLQEIFRASSLSNVGDRENLLAHPEHLVLGPESLREGRTLVATDEGTTVGFATWIEIDGSYELEDLFVRPAWMRRGIALDLVRHIAAVVRARDADALQVTANPHAMAFYRAAGFKETGKRSTAFGDAPRMTLGLNDREPSA
jgi:GNAT superfamily N-acetyltransferase